MTQEEIVSTYAKQTIPTSNPREKFSKRESLMNNLSHETRNPHKHIIDANWGAKTPGPTDLEWLQYAQHFSNFTMISLLIIMPNKIRQLKLFERNSI